MKRAWKSGIKVSADYYDRMSQYNKDTCNMSKEERNKYYRGRNKEDGWFDKKSKVKCTKNKNKFAYINYFSYLCTQMSEE